MSGSVNLPLHFNRDRTERLLDARLAELLEKLLLVECRHVSSAPSTRLSARGS